MGFLFNSHEKESSNFKPERNFSICASRKALSDSGQYSLIVEVSEIES